MRIDERTGVDGGVRDISDGCGFDDVTNHELLDRLVLGSAPNNGQINRDT